MVEVLLGGSHRNRTPPRNLPALDPNRLFPHQVSFFGKPISPATQVMTLAMLQALTQLQGLHAIVTIGTLNDCGPVQKLQIPERMWVWFAVDIHQPPIFGITEDLRYRNQPHTHLYQWLEAEWPLGVDMEHPDYEACCQQWHDSARWLDFFERRIRLHKVMLYIQARALRERAVEIGKVVKYLNKR